MPPILYQRWNNKVNEFAMVANIPRKLETLCLSCNKSGDVESNEVKPQCDTFEMNEMFFFCKFFFF